MKTRLFAAGGLLLALLGALSARADLPEILGRQKLRVLAVVDPKRPEFVCLVPGQPPGFDREVLEGFARLQHVSIEWIPVASWDALIPALLQGKGDVVAGRVSVTPTRQAQVDFTVEVFPTRHVVATRRPHRVVHTLPELRQERVGTVKGTSLADAVADAGIPAGNLDDDVPPGGLADALKAGRITATVWGIEQAIAAQKDDPAIQLGFFIGPPGRLAYGVRKGETRLLRALDAYISNLRRTPTWNRLVVEYFGASAPDLLRSARAEMKPPP